MQFEPESLSLSSSVNTGDQQGGVPEKGLTAIIGAVKRIFHPNDVSL